MTSDRDDHSKNLALLDGEIGRIQRIIDAPQSRHLRDHAGPSVGPAVRPKNAATMILIDNDGPKPRILMGRRNRALKFMPGAFVFPGGSVDRADGSIPSIDELDEATHERIRAHARGRPTPRTARALGMAAIREMCEETGLLIGRSSSSPPGHPHWQPFAARGIGPSLSGLRLLARAITPPGMRRRFDTWFFVGTADTIGHVPAGGFEPSGELEGLQWIAPDEAIAADTREITRVILVELMNRLERDPGLDPVYPAPFYSAVHGRFNRTMMA